MLTIAGLGLATGVGASRAATDVALAGKKPTVRGHRSFFNQAFSPALCVFEGQDVLGRFEDRAAVLASRAVSDCINTADAAPTGPMALHLVLPLPQEGLGEARIMAAADKISAGIAARFGNAVTATTRAAQGQAGLGPVLAACAESGVPEHLIIAVDSYNDRARMDAALRGRSLMAKDNPWGMIPGEAAGALWLSQSSGTGHGAIINVGTAQETVLETDDAETDFTALSHAVRSACAEMGETRAAAWFSDANNSRYRASELAHAILRATPFWLSPDLEPEYPALTLGDCGAAAGMTALHLALSGDGQSLISLGSDNGGRAVIRVDSLT